jgi:hypothetical protein
MTKVQLYTAIGKVLPAMDHNQRLIICAIPPLAHRMKALIELADLIQTGYLTQAEREALDKLTQHLRNELITGFDDYVTDAGLAKMN